MVKDVASTAPMPMTDPVARRLVFHIAGYDPMSAQTAHRRFTRELVRFRTSWGLAAEAGPLALEEDVATWHVTTSGPDWSVETEVRWLRWEDVMARLDRLPAPRRLASGLLALADFAQGGAFARYMRHNWRYALFLLYPIVLLALLAAAGLLAGRVAAGLAGGISIGILAGLAVFAGLLQWARRGLRLDHLLDDWIFAREQIRDPDPVLAARLGRLAAQVVEAARREDVDEVLLLGHSLGAVLAVEIADRALALDPALGGSGATVSLATVGSSIPKLGLHRAARALRDRLGRVGAAEGLAWVDYQAYADVMNFHKFHPVRGLGAGLRGPLVRLVSIRRMLDPGYYRRIRMNLLRVHNQFVSANDLRTIYDYFMLVCGPRPLEVLARAPEGAADCVAADGSLVRRLPPPYAARPGLDRLP